MYTYFKHYCFRSYRFFWHQIMTQIKSLSNLTMNLLLKGKLSCLKQTHSLSPTTAI